MPARRPRHPLVRRPVATARGSSGATRRSTCAPSNAPAVLNGTIIAAGVALAAATLALAAAALAAAALALAAAALASALALASTAAFVFPPPPQLLPHRLRPNSYGLLAVTPTTVAPPPVAAVTVALAAFALTLASATVSTPPPPLPSSLQQLHLPHQQPFFRDRGPLTASTSAFARGGLYWCAQRSPQTPSAPAPPHRPYSH